VNKNINWPIWFVSALSSGWAIFLMLTLKNDASTKEILTVGVLFFVSLILLQKATGGNK